MKECNNNYLWSFPYCSEKMSKFLVLLVVWSSVCVTSLATMGFGDCEDSFVEKNYKPYQPPKSVALCRTKYLAICYDVDMLNPAWSAYYITPEDVKNNIPGRERTYYEDPDLQENGIPQAPANSQAFKEPFNHGHLAPNRIMSFTKETKHATYTMANMAPQIGYFNQQPWNRLETAVFNFIGGKGVALFIITGVAYKSRSNPVRLYDNVAVPEYFFKVICDPKNRTSAGFYGRNVDEPQDLVSDFHTVAEVEQLYGGKLFDAEYCRTSVIEPSRWWSTSDVMYNGNKNENFDQESDTVQIAKLTSQVAELKTDLMKMAAEMRELKMEIDSLRARVGQLGNQS